MHTRDGAQDEGLETGLAGRGKVGREVGRGRRGGGMGQAWTCPSFVEGTLSAVLTRACRLTFWWPCVCEIC